MELTADNQLNMHNFGQGPRISDYLHPANVDKMMGQHEEYINRGSVNFGSYHF